MKRTQVCLAALVLFFIAAISPLPATATDAAEREWLVLVYASGVNDRGIGGHVKGMINQLEKAGSSEKVTIVVKYCMLSAGANRELQFQPNARTLLIKGDKGDPEVTSPVIDTSPLKDMGSPSNLFLFVRKTLARFPARKVMLVLWGKGDGLRGALDDDFSGKRMSVRDIAETLARARKETGKKIDVLVMDANFMQTAEVAYELRDETEIIVASEEAAAGNHYLYDLAVKEVVDNPATSPAHFAEGMAYFAEAPVSSTVRTAALPGFVKLLDRWTEAVANDPVAMKAAVAATGKTFHFRMKESKDLCDFVDRVVESIPSDSLAAKTGRDLKDYVERQLVGAIAWPLDPRTMKNSPYGERSHGLAIYLPDTAYDSSAYESLAFAADSKWSRFLMMLKK
jgi:hypothetical protein